MVTAVSLLLSSSDDMTRHVAVAIWLPVSAPYAVQDLLAATDRTEVKARRNKLARNKQVYQPAAPARNEQVYQPAAPARPSARQDSPRPSLSCSSARSAAV